MVTDPDYKEQIVIFIDLLGFKSASYKDDESAMNSLQLLQEIKTEVRETKCELGEDKISLDAAITAFSDSILISIPKDSYNKVCERAQKDTINKAVILKAVFSSLPIRTWCTKAISLGMLIQGGIGFGKFYHKNDIALGKPLSVAYDIQNSLAIYPRIVLSPEFCQFLQKNDMLMGSDTFIKDEKDGLYYYDYLVNEIGFLVEKKDKDSLINLAKELIESLDETENKILALKEKNDPRVMMKWEWFYQYFKSRVPQELIDVYKNHAAFSVVN